MLSTEPVRLLCKKYGFNPGTHPNTLMCYLEEEVEQVVCGWKEEVHNFAEMCNDYRTLRNCLG